MEKYKYVFRFFMPTIGIYSQAWRTKKKCFDAMVQVGCSSEIKKEKCSKFYFENFAV